MRVSVVIPVFNAERFVHDAVRSAQAQPETGEVILIEDGSTDDSLRICRDLARTSPRVTLLRHPGGVNRGISASRNLGWRAARYPFVAFLDADDYYLENRFRAARRILETDPELDGVYDAVGTTYEHDDAKRWYGTLDRPELTTVTDPVPPEILFETILAGDKGYFHTNGITVRKTLLERTGGFDTSLTVGEDTHLWIKMAAVGRLAPGVLTEPVSMRRVHDHNTMRRCRHRYRFERLAMAESLLRWAHRQSLPPARVRLLLDLLLRFRLDLIDRDQPYPLRKGRELLCLTTFAARHPGALWSRYYRHVLGYTVGGRRFKRLFGNTVARFQRARRSDRPALLPSRERPHSETARSAP